MVPDKVVEIFTAATGAHEPITSKLTCTDIDKFDEKINSILVELPRENDGDKCGILCLSQDQSKCSTITRGSTLTKIDTLSAHSNNIDSSASDSECKKDEALWKAKLNDSKAEVAAEHRAKKMLLATFDDACVNKLKHSIELYA